MRKILSFFRGVTRPKPGSGFWDINLHTLGGPIPATQTEAVNLPTGKPRFPAANSRVPAREPAFREAPFREPVVRPSLARDTAAGPVFGESQAGSLAREPARDPMIFEARVREAPVREAPVREAPFREAPVREAPVREAPVREFWPKEPPVKPPAKKALSDGQYRPRVGDEATKRTIPRDAFLATHGVEKSFGGRKVVNGASIFVRRGEAVGLLGPNGAGKTTVFYMITGLIKPDRGQIELDGNDVTRLPMYQRARLGIGYLPQEASIFRGLNVEDNIRAVLEVVEPNRRRREADLDGLLEEFHITRLRKSPSIALSGGERRRVEIARALASRPNYMLLDEPFAGIDPIAVGDIQVLVRHLTNRGIGVLITDHNVRETLGLTDRAYIIYSGSVLREGQADEIVNDPEVRRLYLGEEFRM